MRIKLVFRDTYGVLGQALNHPRYRNEISACLRKRLPVRVCHVTNVSPAVVGALPKERYPVLREIRGGIEHTCSFHDGLVTGVRKHRVVVAVIRTVGLKREFHCLFRLLVGEIVVDSCSVGELELPAIVITTVLFCFRYKEGNEKWDATIRGEKSSATLTHLPHTGFRMYGTWYKRLQCARTNPPLCG